MPAPARLQQAARLGLEGRRRSRLPGPAPDPAGRGLGLLPHGQRQVGPLRQHRDLLHRARDPVPGGQRRLRGEPGARGRDLPDPRALHPLDGRRASPRTMVVALLTADKARFLESWSTASDVSPTDISAFVFLMFFSWLALYGPGPVSLDWPSRPLAQDRSGTWPVTATTLACPGVSYNQARLRRLNDAKTNRRRGLRPLLDAGLPASRPQPRPRLRAAVRGASCESRSSSTRGCASTTPGPRGGSTASCSKACGTTPRPPRLWASATGRSWRRRSSPRAAFSASSRTRAALVVTDDFPCFIVPGQSAALARKTKAPVFAVDSNSVVPLSLLGAAVGAAAHLRPRIHKAFAEAWAHRAARRPAVSPAARERGRGAVRGLGSGRLEEFLDALPLDATVPEVPGMVGGTPSREGAPSRVPEEAPAGLRRGSLGADRARRGPRERPVALSALRPHLDRGGGRGGRSPPPASGARRSCASTTAASGRASSRTTRT